MKTTRCPRPPGGDLFHRGFTLIELLVVIAILGILAALLAPALRRAKDAGLKTKCLSNLREIGFALQMYKDDNEGRFPTISGQRWVSFRLGGEDPDTDSGSRFGLESATNRVLWQYTTSRHLYRCPADRGMNISPWMTNFHNLYEKIGTSYKYNDNLWGGEPTRLPRKDPTNGIAGKNETFLSQPSSYVLIHEPPATPMFFFGQTLYFFWHYARGPNTAFSLAQARDRSISPILFADGHTAVHDFTANIRANPSYPYEPTADWYWYEPLRR